MSKNQLVQKSEVYAYHTDLRTIHYKMSSNFITSEIILDGFQTFPTHFYKNGGGFTEYISSFAFTEGLKEYMGVGNSHIQKLTISNNKSTSIRKLKGKFSINLHHDDFEKLFTLCIIGKRKGTSLSINSIAEFFHNRFPAFSKYSPDQKTDSELKKMFLSSLDEGLIDKLSKAEIEKVQEFYEKLLGKNSEKHDFILRNVLKVKQISLDSILDDFSEKLAKKTQESSWQKFFEKNIFIFDSRYIDFLPKFNLKSGRKAEPDFLVYDIYGFVDIYEIKRPDTSLIRYDNSHDNYYWSNEMAEAIGQLEKYIFWATENRTSIQHSIKMDRGQEVSIIKPRGVLVIGTNMELNDSKKREDFKILRASLKNIEIILFDEMFNSLQNLRKVTTNVFPLIRNVQKLTVMVVRILTDIMTRTSIQGKEK
ncbi:hypothetical protein SD70_32070, partial [Gordoniibacillus kamchatkensis]